MPFIPKKQKKRPWISESWESYDHSNQRFYNSTKWKRLRKQKLNKNPLCEMCEKEGRVTPATVIDHIKPIRQGGAPLDINNLMSLFRSCHAKKSAKDKHKKEQE